MKVIPKKNAVIFIRTTEQTKAEFISNLDKLNLSMNETVEAFIKRFNKQKSIK